MSLQQMIAPHCTWLLQTPENLIAQPPDLILLRTRHNGINESPLTVGHALYRGPVGQQGAVNIGAVLRHFCQYLYRNNLA